jgi:ribosome biogenesis ATPase
LPLQYVGESERAVRTCFQRAKNAAPCVIFFDEIDSLCPKRSDHGDNGSSDRLVSQLLTEMDGFEARKGVFLMAATNRQEIIDPAVLRPGRLDKTFHVGFPSAEDRVDILRALTKVGITFLLPIAYPKEKRGSNILLVVNCHCNVHCQFARLF